MAIAPDIATGTPFAKFATLNDTLVGAWAGSTRRQRLNYDTKAPLTKPDGSPSLEAINWFIAMPGTTAGTGDLREGNIVPITPGAQVRFSVHGHQWGQMIDQIKAMPPVKAMSPKTGKLVDCNGEVSGDIYAFTLAGWSVETKNAAAASAAGFTVVDGRIRMATQDDKDRYVLAQSRSGGNTNVGREFRITVRRCTPDEKMWEDMADALYASKPWIYTPNAPADGAGGAAGGSGDEEPFFSLGARHLDGYRNMAEVEPWL